MNNSNNKPVSRRNRFWVQSDKLLCVFLIILVMAALGVKYAEPLKDGDLWFHMAYAQYMLENHTLIPDHTIYSWTPTDGKEIYCAWVAEIFLYLIYNIAGLRILFILRYVCLAFFMIVVWFFARENNVVWNPITWLICLVGILMSPAGVLIKPEMFSYVLMIITVYLWFFIKSSRTRHYFYFYLFPIILLIWINSHGGVIFGMTFLGILFTGEMLNSFFITNERLSRDLRKHFFAALILCVIVLFINPYGWEYPAQLIQNFIIQRQVKLHDLMTVGAYQSIFHPQAQRHHFIDYLVFSCTTLIILLLPKIAKLRFDWTLILMNLVFGLLYIRFIRVTYFWAIIFTFSSVYLLSFTQDWTQNNKKNIYKYIRIVVVVIFLFLFGRSTIESLGKPLFGFWVNYVSPVEEAEFIRENLKGLRLGNDYTSGAYLLWALWPYNKIFIDARYFPYKEWYDEYHEFSSGKNPDQFLEKYPCDAWCLTYDFPGLAYFVKSPDWEVAYYGPSACLFTHKQILLPENMNRVADFDDKLQINQAVRILQWSLSINDLETARNIVRNLKSNYIYPEKKKLALQAHIELGVALEKHQQIEEAIVEYQQALRINSRETDLYNKMGNLYLKKKEHNKAIEQFKAALSVDSDFMPALQNLAIIYSKNNEFELSLKYLNKMRQLRPENANIYYNISCAYAKENKVEESVEWLNLAIEKRFNDWNLIRKDPDLDNIRSTEYYRELFDISSE